MTKYLHYCHTKKDGTIVLQNEETYEVEEVKDGKVVKKYFPRAKNERKKN